MINLTVEILKLKGYPAINAELYVKIKMCRGIWHALNMRKAKTDDEMRKIMCERFDYRQACRNRRINK